MTPDPQDFALALGAVEQELNWTLLGELHCYEGGEDFFSPEQVEATRETGLRIAGELGDQLAQLRGTIGRSLYVGMAVGELVPVLVEHFVLGREVVLKNLDNAESEEMNRAFAAAESCGLRLPRIDTGPLTESDGGFDHGWMVSVLNDPEAFPALHDELYERRGALATGRGNLSEDVANANALVDAFLARLTPPALLCTTDEELPVLRPRLGAREWSMKLTGKALLTGVVGDPLRVMRLIGNGG